MTTSKHPKQSGRPPIDPLLAQRLQQLGGRRPAGSPLPPPTAGTAQAANRSQGVAKQAARPAPTKAPSRPPAKPQGTTVISTEPPSRRTSTSAPVHGANAAQTAKLQAAAARAAAARNAKSGGRPAPATGRKNKPAQSSKIASLAISVATTAVLAGIFAHNAGSPVAVTLTGGTAASNGATAGNSPSNTAAGAGAAPASTAAPAANGGAAPAAAGGTMKDGTYVGQTQYNRFGAVQVQAVYAGGKLTDVQILQYEDGDNRSIRINQIALPRLIQQSVAAQGVNVDGVSGATYTTRSYVKSLQSAIDAAKQASGIAG
jgi:uncharacterized protein with FMN-binding domain